MPAEHLNQPQASAARWINHRCGQLDVDGEPDPILAWQLGDESEATYPYIGVQITPVEVVRFNNRRAYAALDCAVTAIGPAPMVARLRNIAAELDRRLDDSAPARGPDGANVSTCWQINAVEYTTREGGTVIKYVGGLYRVDIS